MTHWNAAAFAHSAGEYPRKRTASVHWQRLSPRRHRGRPCWMRRQPMTLARSAVSGRTSPLEPIHRG
jgi:hypothetical protein